jgi:hypothetical protein
MNNNILCYTNVLKSEFYNKSLHSHHRLTSDSNAFSGYLRKLHVYSEAHQHFGTNANPPPPPNGGGGGPPNGGGGGEMSQPSDATVTVGWNVSFAGIPNYDHEFTSTEVASLNSRPKAATDFSSGHTSVAVGDMVVFGDDIGYSSTACTTGYWPPGTNYLYCLPYSDFYLSYRS